MEYLSGHKRIILIFLLTLITIPLFLYLWANRNPRPGSCLILEEKNCKKVQFITNPNAPEELLAAYKVPQGTIVFSPIEGEFSNTPKFLFKDAEGKFIGYPGAAVTSYTDRSTGKVNIKYGFIFFKEKEVSTLPLPKKGNTIGIISDKNIDRLGNFNLLVRIYRSNSEGKTVNDSTLLKTILGLKK